MGKSDTYFYYFSRLNFIPNQLKQVFLSLILVWILFKFSDAQSTIKAVRIETPPIIDGLVKEEVWNQAFMVNKSAADFHQAINAGVSPDMPAFGGQLSDEDRAIAEGG